jgi:hypothetical protein
MSGQKAGLASNGRRPFPEMAADALNECIFNLSIFYRHGPDAIVTTGRTTCTRAVIDIQFACNQHHGGKRNRQHCSDQRVDLVHGAAQTCHGFPQAKT